MDKNKTLNNVKRAINALPLNQAYRDSLNNTFKELVDNSGSEGGNTPSDPSSGGSDIYTVPLAFSLEEGEQQGDYLIQQGTLDSTTAKEIIQANKDNKLVQLKFKADESSGIAVVLNSVYYTNENNIEFAMWDGTYIPELANVIAIKFYVVKDPNTYTYSLTLQFKQEEATVLDINLSDDIGDVLNYNIIANSYLNKEHALSAKIDSDIVYANSLNCTDNISSLEDMTFETRFIATFLKDNLLYEVTFSFVDEFKSYMRFNVTKLTMLHNNKIIGNEVVTIPFTLDVFENNSYMITEDDYKFIYDKLKTGCNFLINSNDGRFKESTYVFDNNKINGYYSFYLENDNLRLDFSSEGNVDNKVYYVAISRKFNHTYCIDHVDLDSSSCLLSAYIYHDLLYMTENNVMPQIVIKSYISNSWFYPYYLYNNNDSHYIELGVTFRGGSCILAKITLEGNNTNIDFRSFEK